MAHKILGIHYEGGPTYKGPIRIVSGPAIAPTQGSYGHADPTLIKYKGQLANVTSDNIWIVPQDGYASAQVDDGVGRGSYKAFIPFDSWLKGSPAPAWNEYVFHHGEPFAIRSLGERLTHAPKGEIQLPKYVHDFSVSRINEAGRMLSKIHNTDYRMGNYSETELAERLEGGKPKASLGSDYIAVGGLPEEAAYGVTKLRGKVVLAVSPDLYERASIEAKQLGMRTEDYLSILIAEEHRHIKRKSFDRVSYDISDIIAEEQATKEDVVKALESIAKGAEGGNIRNPRYHRELMRAQIKARAKKADLETTPHRYRELHGHHAYLQEESGKVSFVMDGERRINTTYENQPVGGDGASMPTHYVGRYISELDAKPETKVDASDIKSMSDAKANAKEAPKESEAAAD